MASKETGEGRLGDEDGDSAILQPIAERGKAQESVLVPEGVIVNELTRCGSLELGCPGGKGAEVLSKDQGQSSGEQAMGKGKKVQDEMKKSFVDLFKDNRTPAQGLALHKVENQGKAGTCKLAAKNIIPLKEAWKSTLIGYFAGKDPGKWSLINLIKKWGVKVKHHKHISGWIVFEFLDDKDMLMVLNGGPYFAGFQPLILKHMPQLFRFEDVVMKTMPVWITFPNLPKQCWGVESMSSIASLLGEPMRLDMRTSTLNAAFYARALVMVDASKDLLFQVTIEFDDGSPSFLQEVLYDYIPAYCTLCNSIGHKLNKCHLKNVEKNKVTPLVRSDLSKGLILEEGLVLRQEDRERNTKSNEPLVELAGDTHMGRNNVNLEDLGECSSDSLKDKANLGLTQGTLEIVDSGGLGVAGEEVQKEKAIVLRIEGNEATVEEVRNEVNINEIAMSIEVNLGGRDEGSSPKSTPMNVLGPLKSVTKNKAVAGMDSASKVGTRQGRRNKEKNLFIGGYKPPNRK